MSNRAQAWAWEQDVPMSTKGVLLALADHADNDGICWPGVKSVAEKCRMSDSTVRYHLRILRHLGLVRSEERKRADGSFTSNIYHLPLNILTPTLQSLTGYPSTDEGTPSDSLIDRNPQGTPIEPPYFSILREIPGWHDRGEPFIHTLVEWQVSKNVSDEQMERSAVGLASAQAKTLKGYTNMVKALQRRVNQGYDPLEGGRQNGQHRRNPQIERGSEGTGGSLTQRIRDQSRRISAGGV